MDRIHEALKLKILNELSSMGAEFFSTTGEFLIISNILIPDNLKFYIDGLHSGDIFFSEKIKIYHSGSISADIKDVILFLQEENPEIIEIISSSDA